MSAAPLRAIRCILAFDCSGAACSAAVARSGVVVAERFEIMARGQSERLIPMIAEVLSDAGETADTIDVIATTVGPGSFTGLRIGLAAAQGLALATGKPIIALTSFEAMLASLPSGAAPCPTTILIDSRRGALFVQPFAADGRALAEPYGVEPTVFLNTAPVQMTRLAGDGVVLLPPLPRDWPPATDRVQAQIRAGGVALAAWRLDRQTALARRPTPLYLRAPDVTLPKRAAT